MDFLYSEMASYKNVGSKVLDSSFSKESNSSIDISKLFDIVSNVLPEHSKISVFPEAISVKVVLGIPLLRDSE